jgi:hypothetical protein
MNKKYTKIHIRFILFTVLLFSTVTKSQNIVNYAGGSAKERFYSVLMLSNKTLLVSGMAQDLNWVPSGVKKVELKIDSIRSASAGNTGFIMQLSADMKTILTILYFPTSTVRDIYKIQTTTIQGRVTGDIYISGNRDVSVAKDDGYFIAKLNDNFVNAIPSGLAWSYNVPATGDHKSIQPWDVGSDGKVVFATGTPFNPNWASIERLTSAGKRDIVPNWPAHWSKTNKEYDSTAVSYTNATDPLVYSAIVMKVGRNGSLRSKTLADYSAIIDDGNGSTKKGKYPDDYYFSGPCHSKACAPGPGYTGYKPSGNPTQRVGAITIDREPNDIYYGYSTQSVLPSGLPDFEPAVVAMDKNGVMKWWSRLYKETVDNSTPDQYVDALAFDHISRMLIVLGRCHGNNTDNLWSGNTIAANPKASGFQNQFTGNTGNIHISWLGKFRASDGALYNSTYVAEFPEGANNYGPALTNPNLDKWPNPNAGWPNVNTTKCANTIAIGRDGTVTILATGRRTMTTKNAFQKMPIPGSSAKGTWNYFVRTYASDLSRPLYSSLITGKWDTLSGAGGSNIELFGVCRTDSGVVAVGYHTADVTSGVAAGNPMPTTNIPLWGNAAPVSEQAVFAKLISDSTSIVTGIESNKETGTLGFILFPNPAKEQVTVQYTLFKTSVIRISVYDILGKEIKEMVNETQPAGEQRSSIGVSKLGNGVYFVILNIDGTLVFKKMIVDK